ncbi:phosphodiesterase [Deinococcus taeanensis]|uniref:phosphodiesterase n=1 Tax=Deinococcus taeanensis TaxID=2737050 RepID=UPI001CDD4BA3|nr:phosphodiesterase [Deinococcus taeanensis]UBV41973.1 phosphodiesterase [Deinococcus taeanensis]
MLLVQLSDPHIDLDRPGKAAAFARAVAHVNALPTAPDAVLLTGDCTEHGTAEEYEQFTALLRTLTVPAYLVPGNHDDRAELLRRFPPPGPALPGFMQYVVNDHPLRLIGLDTHRPGHGEGELDSVRLNWLDAQLQAAPAQPTLIFMHHPPVMTGLDVMDRIGLQGREALCDLLLTHPQVLRVAAGHLHMALTTRFAHTTVMTCPGTDTTLLPELSRPEQLLVQRQPPLCLIHAWSEATGLNSFTQAIAPTPWHALFDGRRWND